MHSGKSRRALIGPGGRWRKGAYVQRDRAAASIAVECFLWVYHWLNPAMIRRGIHRAARLKNRSGSVACNLLRDGGMGRTPGGIVNEIVWSPCSPDGFQEAREWLDTKIGAPASV
jgi:hypothetical protein